MSNLELYLSSLDPVKAMFINGDITKEEFYKAEEMLAQKYCIKIHNLYRPNDLILFGFRGIYVDDQKEEKNDGSQDNKDRRVTSITTKT